MGDSGGVQFDSAVFREEVAELADQIRALPGRPIVLEADWDGDTERDWFVVLAAVLDRPSYDHNCYESRALKTYTWSAVEAFLADGRTVYPQGRVVHALGEAVASVLDLPFHFHSPGEPNLDPMPWWDTQEPGPPVEYEVEWELVRVSTDGSVRKDQGRVLERAVSAREAHQRVIDRVRRPATASELESQGLARIELKSDLLGLEGGPVRYSMRLTPTQHEVRWSE